MTDLSYQTKKVYINKLLAFEEAYATGEVSVVLEAEPEPESHEHAAPSRPALLTKNTVHKRKYGDAYVTTYGEVPATRELLVGKAISVWWNAEGNFHLGNVVQYHPELDHYTIEYESGEVHQTDLKAVHWVPADSDPALGSSQSSHRSQPGAADSEPVTKVYASTTSIPGFEIFTSLPGIRLEEVSVRCWPEGRILIQGDPDLSCAGSAQRVQEELQLPLIAGQKLLPRTAQALFTDTGRLYVKVEATHPTSQGSHFATLTPGPSAEQPAAY
ncbi:hypothetical protein QBZ16_004518 [Prototheca wickerhamii]|uniref:Uncharacterized protein n=1 Tax=Prototheca wickerhamii TaxID=3111 RepID=A0AAD9MI12_PROWI|nr:hypothetical protein QBZ16_004518 [Prototheca wickerhamii]